jgi:hypothetical protein
MIGIFASSVSNMIKGTVPNSMLSFLKPGIIGGISGGLGSLAPIGILPGMAYGVGTGALTGAIGAGFNGSNIGRGALYGGIIGGITGGISGGLEARSLGADIWSGGRSSLENSDGLLLSSFKKDELAYTDKTLTDCNSLDMSK